MAGVDFLTISPALLEELKNSTDPVPKKLDAYGGGYSSLSIASICEEGGGLGRLICLFFFCFCFLWPSPAPFARCLAMYPLFLVLVTLCLLDNAFDRLLTFFFFFYPLDL